MTRGQYVSILRAITFNAFAQRNLFLTNHSETKLQMISMQAALQTNGVKSPGLSSEQSKKHYYREIHNLSESNMALTAHSLLRQVFMMLIKCIHLFCAIAKDVTLEIYF